MIQSQEKGLPVSAQVKPYPFGMSPSEVGPDEEEEAIREIFEGPPREY